LLLSSSSSSQAAAPGEFILIFFSLIEGILIAIH
jgi:hypothetical protein